MKHFLTISLPVIALVFFTNVKSMECQQCAILKAQLAQKDAQMEEMAQRLQAAHRAFREKDMFATYMQGEINRLRAQLADANRNIAH